MSGSTLHASHITVTGGGGLSISIPAPGIVADAASVMWLSDSTIMGGTNIGLSACGIDAPAGRGHLARCTVGPTLCPMPPTGPLLGLDLSLPLQTGQPFTLDLTASPNGFVAIHLTTALQSRAFSFLEQPWWAADGAPGLGFFLADPTGRLAPSWTIPSDPWFTDKVVWFHAIELSASLPLQAAPPVGGLIR